MKMKKIRVLEKLQSCAIVRRMKLINLFGGPGSGKSTAAANIFSELKSRHIKTELVGEFAKELIYLGNEIQLVNQVYIMGSQYRKQKDLERYGVDVAISDSPLQLQLTYCRDKAYYQELTALVNVLQTEFNNINVFIKRIAPYQVHGRMQTEKEADRLSELIWNSMDGNFDFVINGDSKGLKELNSWLLETHS